MSRMKRLAEELAELKRCGEILIDISDTLAELFSDAGDVEREASAESEKSEPVKPVAPAKPVKELKLTDVRAVLAEKSRAGFTKEVKALLQKHGAEKLSAVDAAEYEALLEEAEKLGGGEDA